MADAPRQTKLGASLENRSNLVKEILEIFLIGQVLLIQLVNKHWRHGVSRLRSHAGACAHLQNKS